MAAAGLTWPAQHLGYSSQARHLGHPAARRCANEQIVPQIQYLAFLRHCHGQQHRLRHNAAAAAAATALELQDPTEARLYTLYDFVHTHGRLPKIQDQHKGVAVGHWGEQCRLLYQHQQLNVQLTAALQTIPGWHWQPQTQAVADSFEETIRLVHNFVQQQGRLPKSRSIKRPDTMSHNGQLVNVTGLVRQLCERRRRGTLTQQQLDRIASGLPGWKWDVRVKAPPLDVACKAVQEFVQQHGRLPKQAEALPDGFCIGEWCTERRSEYNRGSLEADVAHYIVIHIPSWSWNLLDTQFENNVHILKQFVVHNGGRCPTQRETFDGVNIGNWCNKVRLRYRKGLLAADKVAELESLEGWWWTADDMPV